MSTKAEIHSRMLRDIARLWGYSDAEVELQAFDPVVSQLLSACASEFDKLYEEVGASRLRVLDRLVNVLTPEVFTAALPAHGILHARALEPISVIKPEQQVYFTKKSKNKDTDIYFSSLEQYPILNAQVKYLASVNSIVQVDEIPTRKSISRSDRYRNTGTALPNLWVGIKLHPQIESLDGYSFYFNWRNEPRATYLLGQLPFTRWSIGRYEIFGTIGLESINTIEQSELSSGFDHEFKPARQIVNKVKKIYDPHFVSIHGSRDIELQSLTQKYPTEFESFFPLEDLSTFEEKLLWIKIIFPEYFPIDSFTNLECHLNCVPVINRRLHKEIFRPTEFVNILPLYSDDYFFDIENVSNEQGKFFHSNPLANLRSLEAGTYILRSNGVGKLDGNGASRYLFNMLDLLRDESAAFAAYNLSNLDSNIRQINQIISELENQISERGALREEIPYLAIKPEQINRNQQIEVTFWSTAGEAANGIPAGTAMDLFATRGFDRDSLVLVAGSRGGSNRKTSSEAFPEFKKALTTRDRVISREDIKTFCHVFFGDRLSQVNIMKGVRISEAPHKGVERIIEVFLTFKDTASTQTESQALLKELSALELELNYKSAGLLPIVFRIA